MERTPSITSLSQGENQVVITGTILHNDEEHSPLHHMTVELSSGVLWWKKAWRVTTDKNGFFSFIIPASQKAHDISLKVLSTPWEKKDALFSWWRETILLEKVITIMPSQTHVHTPQLKVEFWEYLPGLARLNWPKNSHNQPKESTLRYSLELGTAVVYPFLAAQVLRPQRNSPSLEIVKSVFEKNFTTKLESAHPGATKTKEFVMKRFFQGFHSANWRRIDSDTIEAFFNFDRYEFDGENYLPNVQLTATFHKNHIPIIEKISLQWRKMSGDKTPLPPPRTENGVDTTAFYPEEEYTPSSSQFPFALQALLTASNVLQQNGEHLGKCHVYLEGYKIAAERNFRFNPIGTLFRMFGEGLVTINKLGEGAIFGEHGIITDTSALTQKSVEAHLQDRLGSLDHLDWKPRSPLFEEDTEGNLFQVWWQVVSEFVDSFCANHIDKIKDPSAWLEVQRFSQDLVAHSAPWFPLEGEGNNNIWLDTNELSYTRHPRQEYNGEQKAISHITTKNAFDKDDFEKLKNAIRQFIFLSTIGHTLKHDIGADECRDPLYSSMSGGGVDEMPLGRVLPARDLAARTIAILQTLKNFQYGYIIANEDGDMPQEFLDIIEKHRESLLRLGMPPEKIRSRVNI